MPIPRKQLRAAFATLPEKTLRQAAEHNGIRGRDNLSPAELAHKLGWDAINMQSYMDAFTLAELKGIAEVFGVATKQKKKDLSWAVYLYIDDYDRRIEQAKKDKQAASVEMLESLELWGEAQKLLRPTMNLSPKKTKKRVGIWSAETNLRDDGLRLWLTVDLRCHPDKTIRRDGVLQLSVDDCECKTNLEVGTEELRRPKGKELNLYGVDSSDSPCVDILFKRGSKRIQKWLDNMQRRGWSDRDWVDDPSFLGERSVRGYREEWRKHHPLFSNSVYAQLGGWPLTWPEERAIDQLRRKLVIRTYRCSEPWIEVFQQGKKYVVYDRIT